MENICPCSVKENISGSHLVRLRARGCGQQRVHHHEDQLRDAALPHRQLGHRQQRLHHGHHGFQKRANSRLWKRLSM